MDKANEKKHEVDTRDKVTPTEKSDLWFVNKISNEEHVGGRAARVTTDD